MTTRPTFLDSLAQLAASREIMDSVMMEAPFLVYLDQGNKGCIYANDVVLDVFGLSWEEFEGFGWAQWVHPEDMAMLQQAINAYQKTHEPTFLSYRVRRADGTVRYLRMRIRALIGPDGQLTGTVGVGEDVTARMAFRTEAVHLQANEALGRLSARVAHDFNNLLSVIQFAKEILALSYETPAAREHLVAIDEAVAHARALTDQLLLLSARDDKVQRSCVVNEQLRRLEPLLRRALGERVQVAVELSDTDARVGLDRGRLSQAVLNLATNARDAMPDGGRVRVRTEIVADRVNLWVEDNGAGMSEEDLGRACEPFFTTKESGRGVGLGLATVHDLVTLAGGDMVLSSTLGQGTTVKLSLPTVEANVMHPDFDDRDELAPGSGKGATVLLVEDNDALRPSLGYVLAMHGYQVESATCLAEARQLLQRAHVDALVVDVLLPDGRGTDLGNEEHGQLPTVFITGYAGDPQESSEASDRPDVVTLHKPFRPQQLIAQLAAVRAQRGR